MCMCVCDGNAQKSIQYTVRCYLSNYGGKGCLMTVIMVHCIVLLNKDASGTLPV